MHTNRLLHKHCGQGFTCSGTGKWSRLRGGFHRRCVRSKSSYKYRQTLTTGALPPTLCTLSDFHGISLATPGNALKSQPRALAAVDIPPPLGGAPFSSVCFTHLYTNGTLSRWSWDKARGRWRWEGRRPAWRHATLNSCSTVKPLPPTLLAKVTA